VPRTREAIISAARAQFAERGYDRASVRSVAGAAGVDPAMVRYFFRSKLGLFAQVVGLSGDLSDQVRAAFAGDRERIGERVARLVVSQLEDPSGRERLIALVRAASSEPEAARRVREDFGLGHREMIASTEADAGRLGAVLISATVLGLVVGRCIVGLEPLVSAPPEELVLALAPAFQQLLTGAS
jgi:AcrR family transcriptional regulator